MNKIRLLAFLTGLLLVLIGFAKILLVAFTDSDASIYETVVLITIGGMLVLAVRRK
jgi:DNA transposition AAA+ family ATPase